MADLVVTVIAPGGARMGGRFLGVGRGSKQRIMIGFPVKPALFDFQGLGAEKANAGWQIDADSLAEIRAHTRSSELRSGSDASPPAVIHSSARLSTDGFYRWELARWWADGPRCLFVMLNPSTADADKPDNTIRRCISFARREGVAGLDVVNLFALRTAYPKVLLEKAREGVDIIGPENDAALDAHAALSAVTGGKIVAAWGSAVSFGSKARIPAVRERDTKVLAILLKYADVYRFSAPNGGDAPHPLMLPSNCAIVRGWEKTR